MLDVRRLLCALSVLFMRVLTWKYVILCSRNKELELMLVKLKAKIENDAGVEATRYAT